MSGAGKGFTAANALENGGPQQRRVGGSGPDVEDNLGRKEGELPFFLPSSDCWFTSCP